MHVVIGFVKVNSPASSGSAFCGSSSSRSSRRSRGPSPRQCNCIVGCDVSAQAAGWRLLSLVNARQWSASYWM
eukprot:2597672-Pyramimonas_sp.AAC.1